MHTSSLIFVLFALVLQVATKRIDLNTTVSIDSKPAGMVPIVTVNAQWEAVNNTLPNYCAIELATAAGGDAEAVTHQLFVTALDKLLIGNLTVINNKAYAKFCMAMEHGGPPQECASPVELDLTGEEGVSFALNIDQTTLNRHYSIVTASVITENRTVEFDKSFDTNRGRMHVRTTHEMEGTPLQGMTLVASVLATTNSSMQDMRPTAVDVEPYLAPAMPKIDCKSKSTDSLILEMTGVNT
ncbi:hypothetical protein RI367_004028 [Sorochytrium milnesiophthora]